MENFVLLRDIVSLYLCIYNIEFQIWKSKN